MKDTVDTTAPWQAPVNLQVIKNAEQRVIKQLLQALMFEDIISYEYTSVTSSSDNDLVKFTINATPGVSYVASGYIHYSFDIIRLNTDYVERVVDNRSEQAQLEHVITDILLNIEDAKLTKSFVKELRHTLLNEIQSLQLSPHPISTAEQLSYDQLESYLMAGHPYHPSFKSRVGFDLQDNYNYGPEFDQNIEVVWLAVDKELLVSNVSGDSDIQDWIKDYISADKHLDLKQKLTSILSQTSEQSLHRVTNDYGLIPVHPWQWKNTLINSLQPLIASSDVIYLGGTDSQYRAQQSIRTLSALDDEKAYLKLSMHLINTSSTRILAKHTVMNAALITDWLNTLIEEDESAKQLQLAILGETAGISLDHEVVQQRGYQHPEVYGGLAAIWRENVSQHLAPEERAFPLNGVSYLNSDGSILIEPWIEKHGVDTWVEAMINAAVPPVLHVLFGFGMALECHAQNIVLVLKDGLPQKILLKDLHDGVRYSPEHISRKDLLPKLHNLPAAHAALNRGSFIETDDTDGIRDMTVACLFFVAFADIAIFMKTQYGYSEQKFWQTVSATITQYQEQHPEHQARFELFDVFAEKTRIESLAKRRLFGDQVFPIKFINNPLFKSKGEA